MKINSFEEANEKRIARGLQPVNPELPGLPDDLRASTEAGLKLSTIAEEMREGKPIKAGWFPVFTNEQHSSGFGFLYSITDFWFTCTNVGARLEFFTKEDSDHFGSHFIELHQAEKCFAKSEEVKGE